MQKIITRTTLSAAAVGATFLGAAVVPAVAHEAQSEHEAGNERTTQLDQRAEDSLDLRLGDLLEDTDVDGNAFNGETLNGIGSDNVTDAGNGNHTGNGTEAGNGSANLDDVEVGNVSGNETASDNANGNMVGSGNDTANGNQTANGNDVETGDVTVEPDVEISPHVDGSQEGAGDDGNTESGAGDDDNQVNEDAGDEEDSGLLGGIL